MPPRTFARRRRNPDPPQPLREYLRNRAAEAVADVVREYGATLLGGVAGQSVLFPDQSFMKPPSVFVRSALGPDEAPTVALYADKEHAKLLPTLSSMAEEMAERTGRIVEFWTTRPLPEDSAYRDAYYITGYVPSCVKDREAIARSVSAGRVGARQAEKVWLAPEMVGVPKKYRKQVEDLFRQAFENDDLAAYEHAQHLAELVSE